MELESDQQDPIPLVVDVDYTLLKTDVFVEGLIHTFRDQPSKIGSLILFFIQKGIVALKKKVWELSRENFHDFPYNQSVVNVLSDAILAGRKVVLCSAGCQEAVDAVSKGLPFSVEGVGSKNGLNLKSVRKAEYLVERFGKGGYDYIGDARADIPIWNSSRNAFSTRAITGARPDLKLIKDDSSENGFLRGFRFHQWAKNLLVFLPAIAGHALTTPGVIIPNLIAFFSLGLVASGTYFLNDLLDVAADRSHPTKAKRPIPSGALSLHSAILLATCLTGMGVAISFFLPPVATGLVVLYLIGTISYSLKLKTLPVVDLAALTGFYLLRVYIGGAAVGIMPSAWLATFCIFVFFSLACAKRATEFHSLSNPRSQTARRSYAEQDYPFFLSCGIGSGLLCSIIIGLYVQGDMVNKLYSRPDILILGVPLVALWFTRLWFLVHRGTMHSDPVAFALKDSITWGLGGLGLLLLYISTL